MNRKALFWPLAAVLLTACEKGLDEGVADVAPAGQAAKSVHRRDFHCVLTAKVHIFFKKRTNFPTFL
jgi:hypothetical protein